MNRVYMKAVVTKKTEKTTIKFVVEDKEYRMRSPEGLICKVKNMTAFCRSIGLDQSVMSKVARGKLLHHKGWTRA